MSRRSEDKINAIATILLTKGSATSQELIEATGFSKAAIHRYLREPGFREMRGGYWPKRYEFDMNEARNYQAIALDTSEDNKPVGEVKTERPYVKEVDNWPVDKVLRDLTIDAIIAPTTDALNMVLDVHSNVQQFKAGNAKLDLRLAGNMNVNISRAQKALETMYQFLERVKVDPETDVMWWEKF